MKQIAPSILSANFSKIANAVKMCEDAGADVIHIDIMDGHFVPGLTFGPKLVADIKKIVNIPLDVHLMVDNPRQIIPLFIEAGADWISFHIEASDHLHKDVSLIKESGKKAGLTLNPGTPIHLMQTIIQDLDFILLMTVNPGWGGQGFIDFCHGKISRLKNWINELDLDIPIQIDGGVKIDNIEELMEDGADIFVVGSGVFKAENPGDMIIRLKELARKHEKS
jgi:ribulose-phosphate 3-epimerase